jgi:hypothetical protein
MDGTIKKLNFVQAKLGKLLKTNDMGQICTIVVLFLILIVMIFLVIYTWSLFIMFILSSIKRITITLHNPFYLWQT